MNFHYADAVYRRVVEHLDLRRGRINNRRVAFNRSPIVQVCEITPARNFAERIRARVDCRKPGQPRQPSRTYMTLKKLRSENVGPRIQAHPARAPGAGIENIENAVGMRPRRIERAG